MNDKDFLIKYEDLLNKGYCDCNEMNCIDNNSPRRILNIAIKQQKEIERLKNIINELEKWVKERIDNVKYNDYDDMLDKLNELKEEQVNMSEERNGLIKQRNQL